MIIKTDKLRIRVWVTSFVVGCVISGILTALMWATRTAFCFPPFWPGLFFSWGVIIVFQGEQWGRAFFGIVATMSNAAFYAWLTSRVSVAEIRSHGRLSRHFHPIDLHLRYTNAFGHVFSSRNIISIRAGNR